MSESKASQYARNVLGRSDEATRAEALGRLQEILDANEQPPTFSSRLRAAINRRNADWGLPPLSAEDEDDADYLRATLR